MDTVVTIFSIFFVLALGIVLGTLAWGGLSAAPWVPLWKKDVRRMLKLAELKPGEVLYDLGAGDGRILIIAANDFKAKAVGFEIAVLPFVMAYTRIILGGLSHKIQLKYKNFFCQSLSEADVICAFLTPAAMEKLKPKLEKEAKPGCRVVSYAFSIPGWQPVKIDKPSQDKTKIYLYQR